MSGSVEDKKPKTAGRPAGWRKDDAKRVKLPPVHAEEELAEWVISEAKKNKRTKSDMIRVMLWSLKEQQEASVDKK